MTQHQNGVVGSDRFVEGTSSKVEEFKESLQLVISRVWAIELFQYDWSGLASDSSTSRVQV